MKIEQIYTGCLAQGAYYIESNGEVAIVDPLREVQPYIARAEKNNSKIKYVFETHFHADFVSGHLDLARATGAIIVYGPTALPEFQAHVATDGEIFTLGNASIKVLHTPGHTMESCCYLLRDETGKDIALFSGDTLFVGDVGRPDLAQKLVPELTPELLAGFLFESIQDKILPLANDIVIYPAHGAGSACGKNLGQETTDTLGHQKATNYALKPGLTKVRFIKDVLTGLTPPPGYFPLNVLMNIQGYDSLDKVVARGNHALDPEAFEIAANQTGAVLLDTRDAEVFIQGFIPNSINIGINGNFAPWVGALIPDIKQPILIIAEKGREEEVIIRMARVGFDFTIGYLNGGIDAWKKAGKELDHISSITVNELNMQMRKRKLHILDVRKISEYKTQHLADAENIPLDYINEGLPPISKREKYYVYCAGGYRSVIFISILKARGFNNLVNIPGGFNAIKESGNFEITDILYQGSML